MKDKHNKAVRERVARIVAELPDEPAVENVTPLNPGFFFLQRIRSESRPKDRADVKAEMRHKA